MPKTPLSERMRRDVSRLLALIDIHELVKKFSVDWAMSPAAADAFDLQVERVRETLKEAEEVG